MVVRQASGTPGISIVFLHGLGADEHDLMGLAGAFAPNHGIYSVRAPDRYGDGYQWFEIDWESETLISDPGEVDSAAKYVMAQIQDEQVVVLGFSQGGIMAQAIWRAYPSRVAGLMLLSTWPLAGAGPVVSPVPVLIQHGELDPIVPVRAADLLADVWLGDRVELKKYAMAHQISAESIQDLSRWFVNSFGDGFEREGVG